MKDPLAAKARRLHARAIVADTHVDLPYRLRKKWQEIGRRSRVGHYDIPRMRQGGVTAPFFAVYVPGEHAEKGTSARTALEIIDLIHGLVDKHSKDLRLGASVADIRRAKKDGKIAVMMGIEGGHAIEDSLALLRQFYRMGVRYVTLTHTNTNHWADSCGNFFSYDFQPKVVRVHHGLTDFGRQVVREMNRLGMMVDVSHVSDETLDDVLATSRAPIFASHSSCRALSNLPRNLTDGQIRRIAAKGGVVMVNLGSAFLDQSAVDAYVRQLEKNRPAYERLRRRYRKDPERLARERKKLTGRFGSPRADWALFVDHIERVIHLAGPDSAGIGTDFDGIEDPPNGLEDVSRLPRVTEELLRRGHSETVARKVLGENFLRFFSRVEQTARRLSRQGRSPVD